ncbi:ethanolamine utilization protein EutJ [Tissierella sp. MSJ-40]|uniref:Ethanolamine utilization protein EutJ n=1 Tax=Tissierella simiarum TaxID=2841534 RepID=A0ABS6E8J5_9FIRM|nr:ethanolamine utilization protein EutJ [Tissierella simiarum]MBU5439232.1 ethanolamine utilization protein EutJ [Tissierella simiarum]
MNFNEVNKLIKEVEESMKKITSFNKNEELLVGVDLGTAYIVLVVLDQKKKPIACEMEFAQVIRDGLVVDYMGALTIVKRLKEKLEKRLGVFLEKAAIAIPPHTEKANTKTHKYVVEGAGMEVVNILDEPTAANSVLQIDNGVIVDIGGGTTGLAIFKDKEVIYTADEPTGGTHLTLVLAGNYKITFEEAEKIKTDKKRQSEILPIVTPVIQKVSSIIYRHIKDYSVDHIYLVGGTSSLQGVEKIIEKEVHVPTEKPYNPFLVTPLGIAMNCYLRE